MSTNVQNASRIEPLASPLQGVVKVPGDKSISHRSILFSAMAEGTTRVRGVVDSDDVRSSIRAVTELGAQVNLDVQPDGSLAGSVTGWGAQGPKQPDGPIDCGNSGTTARLLMGVLAPWDIEVTITGDESLCKRPMRRITAPLMKMGVSFDPAGKEHLPITEKGNRPLKAIDYDAPMASAQLKTAVLLAGLAANGTTTLKEPSSSRNHTELMLPEYGAETIVGYCTASVNGPVTLKAADDVLTIPGDPSSAAFLVCAALLIPGSYVQIEDVSLNPARIGFVRTLERMGADISIVRTGSAGKEPFGTISVRYTPELHGCEVPADKIASEIDEIPVLSLVAATAKGVTVFRDASELRAKESDRAQAIIDGLALLGVDAWTEGDNLCIEGQPGLKAAEGITFDSGKDHRLAMTWALAGMGLGNPVEVVDFDSVSVSYPTFMKTIERLTR